MTTDLQRLLNNLKRLLEDGRALEAVTVERCLELSDVKWLPIGDSVRAEHVSLPGSRGAVVLLLTPETAPATPSQLHIYLSGKDDVGLVTTAILQSFGSAVITPSRNEKSEVMTFRSSLAEGRAIHFIFDVSPPKGKVEMGVRTFSSVILEG